jgi:gelsolin
MLKEEKIDIAQTNMALFGSDVEKEIKKHAANGEPAWKAISKAPGIQVWRVEKFQIKEWPKNQYGKFYDGDSYIVLHTYKKEDKILYDAHFWLGQYTSQDEAGTAAYKTVELDDYLGGLPVQYREVQGSESERFLSLFPAITIQHGGIDSGFKHVEPEKYRPRLLHIKGTIKQTVVREVPLNHSSLNSGDVFILDEGLKVYQFQGKGASGGEKNKAAQIARGIDDERGSKVEINVLEEEQEDKAAGKEGDLFKHFWNSVGGKHPIKKDAGADNQIKPIRQMYKVSDASGKLTFTEVPFKRASLQEDDVFVVSTGPIIYTWVGKGANANEKKSAFQFAQNYLNTHPDLCKTIPIVRILSGAENDEFHSYFNA